MFKVIILDISLSEFAVVYHTSLATVQANNRHTTADMQYCCYVSLRALLSCNGAFLLIGDLVSAVAIAGYARSDFSILDFLFAKPKV